jgi:hypothetical protein
LNEIQGVHIENPLIHDHLRHCGGV